MPWKSIKLCCYYKAMRKSLHDKTQINLQVCPFPVELKFLICVDQCVQTRHESVCMWVCVSWLKVCNTWLILPVTSSPGATLLYTVRPVNWSLQYVLQMLCVTWIKAAPPNQSKTRHPETKTRHIPARVDQCYGCCFKYPQMPEIPWCPSQVECFQSQSPSTSGSGPCWRAACANSPHVCAGPLCPATHRPPRSASSSQTCHHWTPETAGVKTEGSMSHGGVCITWLLNSDMVAFWSIMQSM